MAPEWITIAALVAHLAISAFLASWYLFLYLTLGQVSEKSYGSCRKRGEGEKRGEIAEKGKLINHPRPIPLRPSLPSESERVEARDFIRQVR